MPIFQFNKLVRDKLPVTYKELGQVITQQVLGGKALRIALRQKLIEEATEIPVEQSDRLTLISEIADVEQVLDDLKSELSISDDEVTKAKQAKYAEKGGFSTGVFVETITLQDDDEWVGYYRGEPNKYPEITVSSDEIDVPAIALGTYLHTKSGHLYEVLGVALHTETNEVLVVYRPLWDSKYELYTRPYEMFVQTVEIDEQIKPRFQKVED